MSDRNKPPESAIAGSHCSAADYDSLYRRSLDDPDAFWREQAKRIDWIRAPETIANWSFDPVEIKWYEDGILNLCFNCVDRHVPERAEQAALIWEGDEPGTVRSLTYAELQAETVRMANCLKALGAGK